MIGTFVLVPTLSAPVQVCYWVCKKRTHLACFGTIHICRRDHDLYWAVICYGQRLGCYREGANPHIAHAPRVSVPNNLLS